MQYLLIWYLMGRFLIWWIFGRNQIVLISFFLRFKEATTSTIWTNSEIVQSRDISSMKCLWRLRGELYILDVFQHQLICIVQECREWKALWIQQYAEMSTVFSWSAWSKTFLSLKSVVLWMAADCATEAHLGNLDMGRSNRSSTLLYLTGWWLGYKSSGWCTGISSLCAVKWGIQKHN